MKRVYEASVMVSTDFKPESLTPHTLQVLLYSYTVMDFRARCCHIVTPCFPVDVNPPPYETVSIRQG